MDIMELTETIDEYISNISRENEIISFDFFCDNEHQGTKLIVLYGPQNNICSATVFIKEQHTFEIICSFISKLIDAFRAINGIYA